MKLVTSILCLIFSVTAFAAPKSIVPHYEVFETKNKVKIHFFKSPNVPIFLVRLYFDGGSYFDPEGQSGISSLMGTLMRKGIPGLDEHQVLEKLDDMASGVSIVDSSNKMVVKAWGLNEYAKPTLQMMFKMIAEPSFADEPFERIKKNRLDFTKQILDSPSMIASTVFYSVLYNGTVAARASSGLQKDLESLTLADVKAVHKKMFRTDQLNVLVVGGKESDEVLKKVIHGIEKLPCTSCGHESLQMKDWDFQKWQVPKGHVLLVDRKGFKDAQVRIGFLGPTLQSPDLYELEVGDTILSGNFNSRLTKIIREKLHLTYSINAGFSMGEKIGSFSMSTSTHQKKVGKLLVEVEKVLREFSSGAISKKEMEAAKEYLIGSFPLELQHRFDVATTFYSNLLNGLGVNYLDEYRKKIKAVELKGLKTALKNNFHLDKKTIVVVGDAKVLKKLLQDHGYKVIVRKPELYL